MITVKELIESLEKLPPDIPVIVETDRGKTPSELCDVEMTYMIKGSRPWNVQVCYLEDDEEVDPDLIPCIILGGVG